MDEASRCRHRLKKELIYGLKVTLMLGQQTFVSTGFAFARKQLLVTALLYYKLSLHSIHVKSTLRQ